MFKPRSGEFLGGLWERERGLEGDYLSVVKDVSDTLLVILIKPARLSGQSDQVLER